MPIDLAADISQRSIDLVDGCATHRYIAVVFAAPNPRGIEQAHSKDA